MTEKAINSKAISSGRLILMKCFNKYSLEKIRLNLSKQSSNILVKTNRIFEFIERLKIGREKASVIFAAAPLLYLYAAKGDHEEYTLVTCY